jgi:calpain-7
VIDRPAVRLELTMPDVKIIDGERILEIFDPGLPAGSTGSLISDMAALNVENDQNTVRRTGLFTMTWDEVCTEFSALNLNWDPALRPVNVKRHW